MKIQLKAETVREVEFDFPSFYSADWYGQPAYFAFYSPEKCISIFPFRSYNRTEAAFAIETLEKYPHQPITREEFRGELMKQCNSLILQTY